ncbi:LysR substrate-binding domain-containing protein [Halobacteriovorax sp. HLS]|uniref:LysR substrate-binding domain-containing protein n=1 Tax=Halobacteriovorax sp. HLS TaxID=2234000 RepID=UPI0013E2FB79|nr:LysR substrate-binding domain-containing protein [Halobacteriovorax sp. HLS]
MEFILSTTEAQLLIQFELNPSLELLAKTLHRDPTAISRQLKRISEKSDFLVKVSGRWKITETGVKFNQATKDYLLSQNKIVHNEIHLKIGSTREFCSRILASNYKTLVKELGVKSISIIALDGSIESALLSAHIDLAFDCEKPYSPDIRFKRIFKEPISPVISSKNFKQYQKITNFKELEDYPHILCERLAPESVSRKAFSARQIVAHTNDIAVSKELCLGSHGWALLPIYTIKNELKSKKLKVIGDLTYSYEKFGVWYLRERKGTEIFYERAIHWMEKNKDLMLNL